MHLPLRSRHSSTTCTCRALALSAAKRRALPPDDMAKLRRYGIRTATDLLQVCESARLEGPGRRESILSLLDDAQEPRGPRRLEVILSTLIDDTWLIWLRHLSHRPSCSRRPEPAAPLAHLFQRQSSRLSTPSQGSRGRRWMNSVAERVAPGYGVSEPCPRELEDLQG